MVRSFSFSFENISSLEIYCGLISATSVFQLLSMSNRQTKEARQRHLVPSMLVCAALLIGAFSFILEPEYPEPLEAIPLNSNNAFVILRDDGRYDVYVDGEYFATLFSIRHSFSDITVYNSIEEVTQNESS